MNIPPDKVRTILVGDIAIESQRLAPSRCEVKIDFKDDSPSMIVMTGKTILGTMDTYQVILKKMGKTRKGDEIWEVFNEESLIIDNSKILLPIIEHYRHRSPK